MAYVVKISLCNLFSMFPASFSSLTINFHPSLVQNLLPLTPQQLFIHYLYYIWLASTPHHRILNGNKADPYKFVNHGCFLFFLWYSLQKQKGLENHVKSCKNCLYDLGIAHAASLGFSPSTSLSQLINHNLFRFETHPNLASKRSVEVMWHDENSLEAASSMPEDSPS
jgi:hypothetical protein